MTPVPALRHVRCLLQALRQRLHLTSWGDKIIVAVVSRLTGQKGVPLIKHAAFRTVERGGQFVLLGSAPDPKARSVYGRERQRERRESG